MFFERNVLAATAAVIAFLAPLCADASKCAAQTSDSPSTLTRFSFCKLAGIRPEPPRPLFSTGGAPTYSFYGSQYREPIDDSAERFTKILDAPSFSSDNETPIYRSSDIASLAIDPYRGRVFGYGLASWGSQDEQDSSANLGGFDVGSYGGALGQDFNLTKYFIWGYGFQATQTEIDGKRADSYDAKLDALSAFLRMSVFDALWHIDLLYGGSKNWETQTMLKNGRQQKFTSTQWFFESEFGARLDEGYTRIEPRVNLRILSLIQPTKAERFFVAQDRPADFSKTSYRMKLGSRFSWEYAALLGVIKPYITADASYEFGNRAIYIIASQAPVPVAYRYDKHKAPRTLLDFGTGFDYALRDTFDVYMKYDVEIGNNYADYLFFAGFNKKF